MSAFWSAWIMGLVVLNLGITFFLFLWGPRVEIPTLRDGTTGHVWAHGVLREGVRRLPLWWVVVSLAMFVAGFAYLALYPGFGASRGILGWTSTAELTADRDANAANLAPLMARIHGTPVEKLAADREVTRLGERLFIDNCAACHGRDAHGNQALGAPDLTDSDWLYGGSGDVILASILDGRHGAMPAWGGTLSDSQIADVANYVKSLSGGPHDDVKAIAGKPVFATNCAACHGQDGKGNQAMGAPNLTDTVWLYGGSLDTIETTIRNGRGGTMPSWRARLGEDDARAVAAFVYAQSHPTAAGTRD
ncbi:MAG: cytochrome-c oxidase, cbb3-type subunit III [Proteobacteria bacterium]|jgi:cytochrome c oxidase cbb3-type subunit 3|nr:cytochrome-c oxidase, cbb3-type subunit III [Pseudomonadota bacterium]